MPNGNGRNVPASNGHNWLGRWVLGGGSIVTIALAFGLTVSKDATIALDVAKQHGQEILQLNQRILHLEGELRQRTQLRYTSVDAEKDFKYVQRDIDACKEHLKNHRLTQH
jgi:hypothetical protein